MALLTRCGTQAVLAQQDVNHEHSWAAEAGG